ncbi:MAG: DNA (cytosine-5-)-methyltransferase, partial [Deltaproteobacteria bacterium]|nr:DNA (cytosine-5-)-methyltransferase [Deltaproteobacteria bacterium]
MNDGLRFADLFAGIGGFRYAFEAAGCKCIWACEIDKFARHTYSVNHMGEELHWRDHDKHRYHPHFAADVRDVDAKHIPDFDILAAGFPCPTFSIAGVSKRNSLGWKHGLDDEEKGQLFFEIVRIIDEKKPAAFLLENVKHLIYHKGGKTFTYMLRVLREDLGYEPVTWKLFDAAKLVPQH